MMLRIQFGGKSGDAVADILWAQQRWHQKALQRRQEVKAGRHRFFVLHPEDLILMKLEAGGPQDLLDVQALLSSSPPDMDIERLKRSAARIRVKRLLDACLREVRRNARSR